MPALPPPYNESSERLPLPTEGLEITWARSHLLGLAEAEVGHWIGILSGWGLRWKLSRLEGV